MANKEENIDIEVGRCVRVEFDDIGTVDGIIIEKDKTSYRVMFFYDYSNQSVERDQIVEVGNFIKPDFKKYNVPETR
jgi:hypothetical protein